MAVTPRPRQASVLIAGAGPTGLVLAAELGRRGVSCVLVDPREAVDDRPKAQLANIRTMEHFRRLGLADEVRAQAPLPPDFPYDVAFVECLLGREITRFPSGGVDALRSVSIFSEPPQRVPQHVVERVLRDHVCTLPSVQTRYGWRLEDYAEADGGVIAHLVDGETGRRETVGVPWLVGCDGTRSTVREIAGIGLSGSPAHEMQLGVFFEAPTLWEMHDKGKAIMYWVLHPRWAGLLGPVDTGSRWWFQLVGLPKETDLAAIDVDAVLHEVVGAPFPHTIVGIQPWEAPSLLADRYRAGRVFLAGDAAHHHPPAGGYGMNAGIGDAVDLGWKLAAVDAGWGDPALLDTYELERRPFAERIVAEAKANSSAMRSTLKSAGQNGGPPGADEVRTTTAKEFRSIGMQLGFGYDESPIVEPDGTDAPPFDIGRYTPTARPGSRLPHAWLPDGSSLFDHLGDGFTLLSVGSNGDGGRMLLHAAAEAAVPMKAVHLEHVGRELFDADFVLVRPDQHVAWRGDTTPADPARLLARVRGGAVSVT